MSVYSSFDAADVVLFGGAGTLLKKTEEERERKIEREREIERKRDRDR